MARVASNWGFQGVAWGIGVEDGIGWIRLSEKRCHRPIEVCGTQGGATSFWDQHGEPQGCGEEGSGCAENQGHLGEPLVALKMSVFVTAMAFEKGYNLRSSMIQLLATAGLAKWKGKVFFFYVVDLGVSNLRTPAPFQDVKVYMCLHTHTYIYIYINN